MKSIVRAHIMHVPVDPLRDSGTLHSYRDGGLVIDGGLITGCGSFVELRSAHPDAQLHDHRGSVMLPGFIDIHVHFPQLPIIGSMGLPLLRWLAECTLPAEASLNGAPAAAAAARRFLSSLARNGTTTALVFGSHLPVAQESFFAQAELSRLRIISGLSLGDRMLPESLLRSADHCYRESRGLIERWHGKGGLRYAVTPRFSVSCSEAVLDVCGQLRREYPDVMVQSHINENRDEVALVGQQFPWADDYFSTYQRYGLTGPGTVYAHNLHPASGELERMAEAGVSVAHCPSSNAFLGSGSFPMQRHIDLGIGFAAASDVGGGTGFSLLKEALSAYEMQMQRPDGVPLTPSRLLHLITGAPARILGIADRTGSLEPGKTADFVLLKPTVGSTLEAVMQAPCRADNAEGLLGALITLAREESVEATWVAGEAVYSRTTPDFTIAD